METISQSFDADLNAFFPFDPFRLPRSSGYIEGIYREWDYDDSEDEDDSDEEEEGEGEEGESGDDSEGANAVAGIPVIRSPDKDLYMHGPTSFVDGSGGLGESFGGMSISPSIPQQIATT